VRSQARELDALVAARRMARLHDAALGLRDTVRELRFSWDGLSAPQQAKIEAGIQKIDGLLDELHENADGNHPRLVARDARLLHLLLDEIAGAFPRGVLAPVGPMVAAGNVKDPFCRMTVDASTAAAKATYGGQTYYFCAAKEAAAFRQNPAPYVALYDQLMFGTPPVFGVKLGTPTRIEAGKSIPLRFEVRQNGQKALTTKFQPVHDRLMHLITVSDDLSWFAHQHPHQARDGRFYLRQNFPNPGRYLLFSDFTPANGSNQIARSEVSVAGTNRKAMPTLRPDVVRPDGTLFKVVDGIGVTLKLSAPLRAGKPVLLTYSLSRNGRPVTDMVPYLAAMGHMIAISRADHRAVHTHAVSAGADPRSGLRVSSQMSTASGPTQTFKLELPGSGLTRVWAQFGLPGRVLTVPFTFQVQEKTMKTAPSFLAALALSGATTMQAAPAKKAPVKAPVKAAAPQKIIVSLPAGYRNGAGTVKAGKPVALTFLLQSDAGCGNIISVPAAKWTRTLKVGERATVVYTPKKSGPLLFQCDMAMYKGTLTVK
ncbi:MAG TPA: YHS domain-containing protein, partial [Abditibacterium sp.]